MFKFYFLYIIFGVFVFYFGPIDYLLVNPVITFSYIVINYGFLFIGFYVGFFYLKYNKPNIINRNYLFFYISLLVLIAINMVNIYRLSLTLGDFNNMNLGELYYNNLDIEKESSLITKIVTLSYPLTMYVLSFGCVYFKKNNMVFKLSFIFLIFLLLSEYILKGTNFGIFLILLPIIINLFLLSKTNFNIINFKVMSGFFFIIFFIATMSSRLDYGYLPDSIGVLSINKDNFIFKILPLSLSIGVTSALSYISQGYYGLSLAFDYPFDTTWGLGGGYFIISKLGVLIDSDLFLNTYQSKMDNIWSSKIQWHTAFLWLANDIGFYLVPIVMLFFGAFVGILYKRARNESDILSKSLFSICVVILMFLPANNILFGNPLVFMSFWGLSVLWFMRRIVIK